MSITAPPARGLFRTAPTVAPAQGVDRENNRIIGAAVIQIGELNAGDSRPWVNDEITVQQVIDFGNAGDRGTKARFTHPSMSNDGLGKYLGRWSGFRLEGDIVRADLQIADSAFSTPQGDLGTYVMDLAEEDPDSFGNSIAFAFDDEAMDATEKDGVFAVRLSKLIAVDVVDEPAATSGFFSRENDRRDLPAMAVQLLDTHFAGASADVIAGRVNGLLERYFQTRGLSMTTETLPAGPAETPEEPALETSPAETAAPALAVVDDATRLRQITALCSLAGCPDKAAEFFDSGMSRAEAQQYLRDSGHLEKSRPLVASEQAGDPEPEDENEKFRTEYKEHVLACRKYSKKPVSEEQFIRSRRIDAGLEPLVPAGQN